MIDTKCHQIKFRFNPHPDEKKGIIAQLKRNHCETLATKKNFVFVFGKNYLKKQ